MALLKISVVAEGIDAARKARTRELSIRACQSATLVWVSHRYQRGHDPKVMVVEGVISIDTLQVGASMVPISRHDHQLYETKKNTHIRFCMINTAEK